MTELTRARTHVRVPRTSLRTSTGHDAAEVRRRLGLEIRRLRLDAGLSVRTVAVAAGIDHGYLSQIETGQREPSFAVLIAIGRILGADLSVHLYPNTGPAIHDRIQAPMGEAVLRMAGPRWKRLIEVAVRRPARGFIDIVLVKPVEPAIVAVELHSDLRRIEQQVRWAAEKADSLSSADAWPMVVASMDQVPRVSRLLVLRSTPRTRTLAREFAATLGSAYPSPASEVFTSLTGNARWPGDGLLWCRVEHGKAELLPNPPRGVAIGR